MWLFSIKVENTGACSVLACSVSSHDTKAIDAISINICERSITFIVNIGNESKVHWYNYARKCIVVPVNGFSVLNLLNSLISLFVHNLFTKQFHKMVNYFVLD